MSPLLVVAKISNRSFLATIICLAVLLLASPTNPALAATTLYVKPTAAGSGNCSTWANACTLQAALGAAASGDEIWVAAGTHKPHAFDRTVSFVLESGVGVYGGFAGTEILRSQRDIAANPTILSGDLAGGTNAENSYHVVVGSGTNGTAVLDGFTISGGNANAFNPHDRGGGMLNQVGSPTLSNVIFSGNSADFGGGMFNNTSSPTLTNVIFTGNAATNAGGGMRNNIGSSPTLTDVAFSGNSASGGGGGMSNGPSSSPTLSNVTFSGNSASSGGGMSNSESSPALTDVTFSGNLANDIGGGMFNGSNSSPILTNVTFSGNSASNEGGGMYNSESNPVLTNVTFSDNSATDRGGGMFNFPGGSPMLTNVIIANSSGGGDCVNDVSSTLNPASSHNLIEDSSNACGLANGINGNIIGSDPNLGPLANNGGATHTHALLSGSPAIDAGTNSGCPATDQRGITRPVGASCDMGAFERYTGVYHVKPTAAGNGNCSTWADACTLQAALGAVASGDEVWVAAGTYTPHASDRTVSFVLKSGVGVYGGFAGTETARSQRNIAANPTILSGDLAGGTNAENSYHVVVGSGTDSTAVLDGFTISGGNANGEIAVGGGMLNGSNSSPTLNNVTFSGNSASSLGGGMFNDLTSSPTLTDVTFTGNAATWGGGMYNYGGDSTLSNVTFSSNTASAGGGMFNEASNPTLTNVTFSGNSASNEGGGMYNYRGSPTLTDVTFSGNSASGGGGGMYNYQGSPTLTNVIIANSSSGGDCVNGVASILHPASNHNLIEDGANACGLANGANGNIIGSDPNLGPLADNGGATYTHALLSGSPAIDTGTNSGCPATDQRGMTRPVGASCDIGAFELYAGVYHVKTAATGNMDCQSWADACALQFALKASAAGDEVWVAAGTYKPHASDQAVSFVLKTGVGVYGGFAGTETARSQRDIAANPTILSGDLTGNDNANVIYTEPTRRENAYHVVVGSGTDTTAVLDGFTITGGNARTINPPYPNRYGGGMFNETGSPTLANVTFSSNTAMNDGGGMYNSGSNPTLTDVTFSNNRATHGGGMYNYLSAIPTLTDVTFSNNRATHGGGMVNVESNPVLTNVTFSGNSATDTAGGMLNTLSSPTLTNVTFSGNSAEFGGGMFNEGTGSATLTNVIIANSSSGGDCVNWGSTTLDPASSHNLIEDSANACGLANGVLGNIIGSDPNLGPLADNGGPTRTHALLSGSPAINAGTNSGCPATDQRGMTRPVGASCDIGAYETQIHIFLPLIKR